MDKDRLRNKHEKLTAYLSKLRTIKMIPNDGYFNDALNYSLENITKKLKRIEESILKDWLETDAEIPMDITEK